MPNRQTTPVPGAAARSFGLRLRNLRVRAELTQAELASLINVSKSTVSMYENGRREPAQAVLLQLCSALHTTVSELLEDRNPFSTDSLKFALFGSADISDADLEEVFKYADFIKGHQK